MNRTEQRHAAVDALMRNRPDSANRFFLAYTQRSNPKRVVLLGDADPELVSGMILATLRNHHEVGDAFRRMVAELQEQGARTEPSERPAHLNIDEMGLGGMPEDLGNEKEAPL